MNANLLSLYALSINFDNSAASKDETLITVGENLLKNVMIF